MYNVKRVRYVTEVCLITFHRYIKCFKQYNVVEIVFKDVHKIPFMKIKFVSLSQIKNFIFEMYFAFFKKTQFA